MTKEQQIGSAYGMAKERYAAIGVDTESVIAKMQDFHLSLHCWQADDVAGFERVGELGGGLGVTGNYPGKARNMEELRADILKAMSLIPGSHRLNLHEIYGDFGGRFVERDQCGPATQLIRSSIVLRMDWSGTPPTAFAPCMRYWMTGMSVVAIPPFLSAIIAIQRS